MGKRWRMDETHIKVRGQMTGFVDGNATLAALRESQSVVRLGAHYAMIYGTTNALNQLTQMSLGLQSSFDVSALMRGMASAGATASASVGIEAMESNLLKVSLYAGSLVGGQGLSGIPPVLESLGIGLLGVMIDYTAKREGWYDEKGQLQGPQTTGELERESHSEQTLMAASHDKDYYRALSAGQGQVLEHILPTHLEPEQLHQGWESYRSEQRVLARLDCSQELTAYNGLEYQGAVQQGDFLSGGQLSQLQEGALSRELAPAQAGVQGLPDIYSQMRRAEAQLLAQEKMTCVFEPKGPGWLSRHLDKVFQPFQSLQSSMFESMGVGSDLLVSRILICTQFINQS